MKLVSLTSTISISSSWRNLRSRCWAAAMPPNPPPSITTRFMDLLLCLEADARVHEPTIDEVRSRRAIARLVGCQPGDELGDLGGLGHPAERDRTLEFGALRRIGHGGGVDRRVDGARANPHNRDAVRSQLDASGSGEHAHPALGAAVSDVA